MGVTEWHFGYVLCKLVPYLQAVAVSASVNTLAVIAVERLASCDHQLLVLDTLQVIIG